MFVCLILRVQLPLTQHSLALVMMRSHYLYQWWPWLLTQIFATMHQWVDQMCKKERFPLPKIGFCVFYIFLHKYGKVTCSIMCVCCGKGGLALTLHPKYQFMCVSVSFNMTSSTTKDESSFIRQLSCMGTMKKRTVAGSGKIMFGSKI